MISSLSSYPSSLFLRILLLGLCLFLRILLLGLCLFLRILLLGLCLFLRILVILFGGLFSSGIKGCKGFQLFDYAAREYGDMLRFFYQPRWKRYLKELYERLERGEELIEYDSLSDAVSFINSSQEYSDAVSSELCEAVNEILALS